MDDIDDTTGLRHRMERAIGDLTAPDVAARVMAGARRHRHHQRVRYAAGGVAAVAAAGAIGYPLLNGDDGRVASDPDRSRAPGFGSGGGPSTSSTSSADGCGERAPGWWDMPAEQVRATLAGMLPAGVRVGRTEDAAAGVWSGNLVSAEDPDFAMVTLLPPPGDQAPALVQRGDATEICVGSGKPLQEVEACDAAAACEEIRDDAGNLIGVVTTGVESTVTDSGEEVATDKSFVTATLIGPDGGYVEVYAAEGTRDDVPGTVHDPADRPALTVAQARDIVTDPVWTSYSN